MEIIFIIFQYLIIVLVLLFLSIFIFLNTSSQFGAAPNKESKKLIQNSKNFNSEKFVNLNPVTVSIDEANLRAAEKSATLKDWISPAQDKNPLKSLPTIKFKSNNLTAGKLVWLGHSTLLMNTGGLIVMTDPVFNRASPLPIFK